jgi:hypothetical protein
VSTGFIYRWSKTPSQQIDILIWDADQHAALLEEGELAILTLDAVLAIIEVKSVLTRVELRKALNLLHPEWLIEWSLRSDSSRTGRKQQIVDGPLRAVFAYTTEGGSAPQMIFEELAKFYRSKYGADAEQIARHRGGRLRWSNFVDAICVADSLEVEQTGLLIDANKKVLYDGPGFGAFKLDSSLGKLAVGKFCLFLLWHLLEWTGENATTIAMNDAEWPLAHPAACLFGGLPRKPSRVRIMGRDIPVDSLWTPKPSLWTVAKNASGAHRRV